MPLVVGPAWGLADNHHTAVDIAVVRTVVDMGIVHRVMVVEDIEVGRRVVVAEDIEAAGDRVLAVGTGAALLVALMLPPVVCRRQHRNVRRDYSDVHSWCRNWASGQSLLARQVELILACFVRSCCRRRSLWGPLFGNLGKYESMGEQPLMVRSMPSHNACRMLRLVLLLHYSVGKCLVKRMGCRRLVWWVVVLAFRTLGRTFCR